MVCNGVELVVSSLVGIVLGSAFGFWLCKVNTTTGGDDER